LANELAQPGFERELIPLLMYRGSCSLGRYQRLWNMVVAMMMHEADSFSEGINHLHLNPEWSQLCFPDKRVTMMGMRGFFTRLRDNPAVTNLVPGLTEYVEWLHPSTWAYERVSLEASRSRCAWWRVYVPKQREPLPPPDGFEDIAAGKPNGELAQAFGVSEYHIAKWKHLLGIETYRRPLLGVPLDFEEYALEERNFELAVRFGVSGPVIARWRQETGVECQKEWNCGREVLAPPADFYEVANGKSYLWAERHYGRSQKVIRRWFKETGAEPGSPLPAVLSYPYLVHEGRGPEHELLRLINAAVPHHLPPDLRADMCQDLAVGCLTGEFRKEDLHLPAREVVKRVTRMFPTKYGPISLDAPVIAGSDLRLLDTLIDEGRDWA
jgi:hypothetical protein